MRKAVLSNLTIPVLLLADGLICVLTAFLAHAIGLDPDITWGRFRYILFFSGTLLVLVSLFLLFSKRPDLPFLNAIQKSENLKTIILLGHIWAVIFVIYAWFITFGTFTTWKKTTRYYTQLADAFGKGQLYIDADPGEAILHADDPYSDMQRPPFDLEIWDMSLYKGKLYLYWGPVPALLITPIQRFTNAVVTDIYLVYFFFCGLLIVNSLVIVKLWRHFFSGIPIRYTVVCIFLIGLILPIPWSLNIPDVYEAAIGAGQFFLIGGIYFAILALEGNIQKRHLFLAGLFWACSVGSRAINALPVIFTTALTAFWIWKNQSKATQWKGMARLAISLLTPLTLGAILIGWYNWARFDSPLEFGLRYQITIYNLNRDMHLTFQPEYFPFNFYAYIFQPFELIQNFPFVRPVMFSALLETLNVTTPKLYAGGRVTGILFYAPALLLALIPFFQRSDGGKIGTADTFQLKRFILCLLGGSSLISFATILFYFYGQMRFLVDLISQLTLLSIMGYWQIVRNSNSSKKYLHLANMLILTTVIISILLAFSSETNRMEKLNPLLMEKLDSFFTLQK